MAMMREGNVGMGMPGERSESLGEGEGVPRALEEVAEAKGLKVEFIRSQTWLGMGEGRPVNRGSAGCGSRAGFDCGGGVVESVLFFPSS